ncbi:salicylate-AMP-ligase [Streptococcus agalactiae]|uniref:AMP-binding protein n=1 Tax=Streptococcus agalactiae TaxID=1311 RepID=UPI000DFE0E6D|nr:AMP-binding protein [Streptococcus agalactiae]SUN06883.1 salicylate-AMP-ligase [Streptococcus agalactiae]
MNIDLKNKLEKYYDENVWDHTTLGEFITDCVNKYGDNIAVVNGDIELSYKDIDRQSNSFANGLLKAGFKCGDKIVLQLPNL